LSLQIGVEVGGKVDTGFLLAERKRKDANFLGIP
jgi:hypothetical protein